MPRPPHVTDPYSALGIVPGASQQTIERAYRRIGLENHPARNPGDSEAAQRFVHARRAYALLLDEERRSTFERTGECEALQKAWDDSDAELAEALREFDQNFAALPPPDGASVPEVPIEVTLEEVERGGRRERPVPCGRCSGSGASPEGGKSRSCASCGGSGHSDDGALIEVWIPRGVLEGERLETSPVEPRFRFVARVAADRRWTRTGADLQATARIPYELAVLGGTFELELPGRAYEMTVPPGSDSGDQHQLPGQGLPRRGHSGRGDLVVLLHVKTPTRVGRLERWLLESRLTESLAADSTGLAARLSRVRRRAWEAAADRWVAWRASCQRSSQMDLGGATASLRLATHTVSESAARLRPLLPSDAIGMQSHVTNARNRMRERENRPGAAAPVSELAVDGAVAAILSACVWLGWRYAAPALGAMEGGAWWDYMAALHPAGLAAAPLAAGLAAGGLRARGRRRWLHLIGGLPLLLLATGAAAAVGSASYAVALRDFGGSSSYATEVVSAFIALAVSLLPLVLFFLGSSLSEGIRGTAGRWERHRDRHVLRRYEKAAAGLGEHLTAVRDLLSEAARLERPLTLLLERAARNDPATPTPRTHDSLRAALALVKPTAITVLWILCTVWAVDAAFGAPPAAPAGGTAAVMLTVCLLGAFLPRRVIDGGRPTTLLIAATILAVVLVSGVVASFGAGADLIDRSLVAAAALAAFLLSFSLRDSREGAWTLLLILVCGGIALLLTPAPAVAARKGTAAWSRSRRPVIPRF